AVDAPASTQQANAGGYRDDAEPRHDGNPSGRGPNGVSDDRYRAFTVRRPCNRSLVANAGVTTAALRAPSKALMTLAFNDIRFAIRGLLRSPLFAIVATLSLALGIGANTSIFTLIDQVILRKLPIARPDELVM